MQKQDAILPLFLQMDKAYEKLDPTESPCIKGVGFDINSNPRVDIGTSNPIGQGQNMLVLTPSLSNVEIPAPLLPPGYNKNHGSFYSEITKETYILNYNGNGNHGIYVLSGDTGIVETVIVDPALGFFDEQEQYMSDHRCMLRVSYDKELNPIEKFLLITDGRGWQKWIDVIAAIKTKGFNSSLFPYWTLKQPHFDRRELVEWALRPIMYCPIAEVIPNTSADAGKINRIADRAFQFMLIANMTDGRYTAPSNYSLPAIVKTEDFITNPDSISKNIKLTLYAGSPLVESIDIYVRQTSLQQGGEPSKISWGAWLKYDRVYKFDNCGVNDPSVIGTQYWLRVNPFPNNNYDTVFNTFTYIFDNSRIAEIPNVDTNSLQTDMPQVSTALTALGDAALLGGNRYGYPNLPCQSMDNMDFQVAEKNNTSCNVETRKIRIYAYIARPGESGVYYSQIGYYVGADTQMRWGSLGTDGTSILATYNPTESKEFGLDFADRTSFRCYLKGTPFYADGVWYQVNQDNSLVKVPNLLDFGNNDNLEYVQNVFKAGGFFVAVFDFVVPAGKYLAAIGRHNVQSSANYRGTSTYVYGIGNSRQGSMSGNVRTLKPNCLQNYNKEMELDCISGDIDTWGNGHDLFYIYCPFHPLGTLATFRFLEGYLQESPATPIGVERFSYNISNGSADDWGHRTDKNGFYWAYTKKANSGTQNTLISCKLNCQNKQFIIPTSIGGTGWRPNAVAYITTNNNGVVGDCNRVVVSGKITSLDGSIPYANIGISIFEGETVYTKQDGTFELIVHNGQNALLQANIYVNAGGNFTLTQEGCGYIPTILYNEANAPCFNCTKRIYPIPINLKLKAENKTQFSLKENSIYPTGIIVADLAGRRGFANLKKNVSVPSFQQRADLNATFFQMQLQNSFAIPDTDMKWATPAIGQKIDILRFIQWVGDSVKYIDGAGNVVTDPALAVFVSIAIDSLYNANVSRNFTLLSTYQFTPGDRLRVMDDGNGNLIPGSTPIDLQILGTNYNEAAMTAGLIPNTSQVPIINNTVNNNVTNQVNTTSSTSSTTTQATAQNNTSITLYVRYDSRFDALINSTGIWIEISTPAQQVSEDPFYETQWYPVINGKIAVFTGFDANGKPKYNYPSSIDVDFWDTYFLTRNINIPKVGDKYFNHPFESENISDSFGYQIVSGGKQNVKNDNARQIWYGADVIKSDNLLTASLLNGLATFKKENRKDFSQYPWGDIVAMKSEMSLIFILFTNNYITCDFNFHFTYPNEQGVMVTNLDNGLSSPHMKVGDVYGCEKDDTGSVVFFNGNVWWYDKKNQTFVMCNYRKCEDLVKGSMQSYFDGKTEFITNWNNTHDKTKRFDVICGVDAELNRILVTFRPRRGNTNSPLSYTNDMRNARKDYQETLVYSIDNARWTRFENFTPESYGRIMGNNTGIKLICFGSGKPYYQGVKAASFLNYFGIQTSPSIYGVFNKDQHENKIYQSIAIDSNGAKFYIDMIYTNEHNSMSYIPSNQVQKKENIFYAAFQRDMNSYPPVDFLPVTPDNPGNLWRSMLVDGKRIYSLYVVFRLAQSPARIGQYFELKAIYSLTTESQSNKK